MTDDFDDLPLDDSDDVPEPDGWTDDALADREQMSEPLVMNWRELSGDERASAREELADWVQGWLVPRYTVKASKIPDCWYEHSDLVEELSALYAAWQVAFDPLDGGYGPIGWHERFALALTRSAFKERCVGKHRADPERIMPRVTTEF